MVSPEIVVKQFEIGFVGYLARQPTGICGDKRPGGYFDNYVRTLTFQNVNFRLKGWGPVLLGRAMENLLESGRIESKDQVYFLNPTGE